MWNPKLPVEQRVKDLIGRLTLEEKVAQMLNATPAIPRLGIPAYDWWNEVLHGVARTPFRTTVFPQAIGMAATWDTNALFRMADYSALEGRAIYNKALALGRTKERYLGLTYWTPNINIFRDPRWGRGQETYGEDPFLTSMLARSFVRGLQGEDPKYLKAAACAKHFAVHSGPEPTRHSDNFNPTTYDLWDTYLPAFRELVTVSKVAGVMCAYNALNEQPCCGNDLLMNNILRNQWKFTGYVTSDCWAIDDFFKYHKTHQGPTEAAMDAVIHGTDVECGTTVYYTLVDAVKKGLMKEEQLDISLNRLFTTRYRLGMFDPVAIVPYAQTPASVLESEPHKAHALQMARQSIVLLKNENHTLPLKKQIKKIALLGPNADNSISVLGNYNGIPTHITTLLEGIKEKLGSGVEVVYEKAVNFTNDTLMQYENFTNRYTCEGKQGFKAEYFDNENLKGTPIATRMEPQLDHFWAEGQAPAEGLPHSHYSARYTTTLKAEENETLNFEIEGDDGYRLYINDTLKIDSWLRNRWGAKQLSLPLKKGSSCKLVVEFFQTEGNAFIKLRAGNYYKTDVKDRTSVV
jgi:beta-glucosidase